MSKQRAQARAERQARLERTRAAEAVKREAELSRVRRRQRRELAWRRARLWRHGPAFRRDKEKWAALGTIVLIGLLLTYFVTQSVHALLLAALVGVLAVPALAAVLFDRRS